MPRRKCLRCDSTVSGQNKSGLCGNCYKQPKTFVYRHCLGCGKQLSRNNKAVKQLCLSCSRSGEGNSFFGKTHSKATRMLMRRKNALRDRTTYRGGNHDPAQLSEKAKAYWAKVSPERKAEQLRSFVEAGQKSCKKGKATSIERKVWEMLDCMGAEYENSINVSGKYVDVLVEKHLVVECFGDYWHCNPRQWDEQQYSKSLKCTAGDKWAKDYARLKFLQDKGMVVLVFWEHDINTRPDWVAFTIEDYLTTPL